MSINAAKTNQVAGTLFPDSEQAALKRYEYQVHWASSRHPDSMKQKKRRIDRLVSTSGGRCLESRLAGSRLDCDVLTMHVKVLCIFLAASRGRGNQPLNYDIAVELLSLPDRIRGYGPVKEKAISDAKVRYAQLSADLANPPPAQGRWRRSSVAKWLMSSRPSPGRHLFLGARGALRICDPASAAQYDFQS